MKKTLAPLKYKNMKQFMHCKSCIDQFLQSPLHQVMTPRDYGLYEIGLCEFKDKEGNVKLVMSAWCKRCGMCLWDGRA